MNTDDLRERLTRIQEEDYRLTHDIVDRIVTEVEEMEWEIESLKSQHRTILAVISRLEDENTFLRKIGHLSINERIK